MLKVILTSNDLVGLSLEEAKQLIFKNGYRFKIIREGSIKHPLPSDKRNDRFLLSTSSDVVVEAVIS